MNLDVKPLGVENGLLVFDAGESYFCLRILLSIVPQ